MNYNIYIFVSLALWTLILILVGVFSLDIYVTIIFMTVGFVLFCCAFMVMFVYKLKEPDVSVVETIENLISMSPVQNSVDFSN